MNVLFFVVGSSTIIHQQARFAMESTYVHSGKDDQIYMLTDSPALYEKIPFVKTELITKEEIKEWQGEKGYFFRVKINAIRKFIESHNDQHLMFMDTDVFFHGDIENIKECLERGIGIMHKDEQSMTLMDPKSGSGIMWNQTHGKLYGGVTIGEQYHMWNSGVVGIPKNVLREVIEMAMQICDDFLNDGVTCFNLEQWAVSIALQEHTDHIEAVEKSVFHYWHYKYVWCKYISHFFSLSYSRHGSSVEWELDKVRSISFPILHARLMTERTLRKLLFMDY